MNLGPKYLKMNILHPMLTDTREGLFCVETRKLSKSFMLHTMKIPFYLLLFSVPSIAIPSLSFTSGETM
jgi:hypothetical protein